jgi:opacity protein-like surface antigen
MGLIRLNEQGVIVLKHHAATTVSIWILANALTLGLASEVRAQGILSPFSGHVFISPLIGYDFGFDSGCPNVPNCQDKKLNVGVALGSMGHIMGIEEEFAYAKDFYGSAPGLSSNVLTLMSNLMVVPAIGPLHPYALGGVGLIRSNSSYTTTADIFGSNNHDLGWDAGGGAILLLGWHLGIRGDFRYFRSFQTLSLVGFTVNSPKLDFGRVSGGLVVSF